MNEKKIICAVFLSLVAASIGMSYIFNAFRYVRDSVTVNARKRNAVSKYEEYDVYTQENNTDNSDNVWSFDAEDGSFRMMFQTEDSMDIERNIDVHKSELDGYFRDDRKGRAVNITRCGETMVKDGVYGIVNRFAIEGMIYDVERGDCFFPGQVTVRYELDDPDKYIIFKSLEQEENGTAYHILYPIETSYDESGLYAVDESFSDHKVNTYALVNAEKLMAFHTYVNGKELDDVIGSAQVSDRMMLEFDVEYNTRPDFSDYSEEDDYDGDKLNDYLEITLGLDPESPETAGKSDETVQYLQKFDEDMCGDINGGNPERKFFAEAVAYGDIKENIKVEKLSDDTVFRDERNGRMFHIRLNSGYETDALFRGRVNHSAIIGDIAEISVSENYRVKYIRAGFELPDVPENELQYYRVATSKETDNGDFYLVANENTIRTEHSVLYSYNKDVKAVCLVDMRLVEKFAEESNHLSYEEELSQRVYTGDLSESNIEFYEFY